jgi:hypothetical protein
MAENASRGRKRGKRTRGNLEALDAFRERMGTVSDDIIAKDAGVSRALVGTYRRKYGIAAYAGYKWQKGVGPPRRERRGPGRPRSAQKESPAGAKRGPRGRLDQFADLIGTVPDSEIAVMAGVSRPAVATWRHRRGIPPARVAAVVAVKRSVDSTGAAPRRRGRPPGSKNKPKAPVAAAPAVATKGLRAFAVAVSRGSERKEYVAVGSSIVDAAQRIAAALGGAWSIDELKVLGLAV